MCHFLGDFSTGIDTATVVTKGILSLIEYSKQRGDVSLQVHLEKQNGKEPLGGVLVHAKCRRAYVDPKRAKRFKTTGPETSSKKLKLRSNQPTFKWRTHCIFCDEKVCFDSQHPDQHTESRQVGGKEESVLLIKKSEEDVRKETTILVQMYKTSFCIHGSCFR